MNNNITPSNPSDLIPGTVIRATRHNLRNSDNIMTLQGRTNYMYDLSSFLSSTVSDWNNLPPKIAQSDSVASFKYNLNRERANVPKYFYSGNRYEQVPSQTFKNSIMICLRRTFQIPHSVALAWLRMHITSFSNVPSTIMFLKRLSLESKECTEELKSLCAYFLGQNS